jgi:hypothetical protein
MSNEIESVDCRMYVAEVKRSAYNGGGANAQGDATLRASTQGEKYKAWSVATPQATFEIKTINPAALEFFNRHLGKDMQVLIRLAPEADEQ